MATVKANHDHSYITIGGGAGNIEPLYFEAAINPYYMLFTDKKKWGIEVSAKVIVRMYQEYSCPIRTPSYMPRITGYLNTTALGKNFPKALFISWCHHSNGQDGSFYYTEDTTRVNTFSGDFSTNMFEIGACKLRRGFLRPKNEISMKLSSEYHYRQSNQLHDQYGNLRFNGELRTKWNTKGNTSHIDHNNKSSGSFSTRLYLQWRGGNLSGVPAFDMDRLTMSAILAYSPAFFNEISFFGQYYYGQDYYNIYFSRVLSILRVGIFATLSK